jgi:hypothetical protein
MAENQQQHLREEIHHLQATSSSTVTTDVAALHKEIADLKAQVHESSLLLDSKNMLITTIEDKHARELKELNDQHKFELEDLRITASLDVGNVREEHDRRIQQLTDETRTVKEQTQEEHEKLKQEIKDLRFIANRLQDDLDKCPCNGKETSDDGPNAAKAKPKAKAKTRASLDEDGEPLDNSDYFVGYGSEWTSPDRSYDYAMVWGNEEDGWYEDEGWEEGWDEDDTWEYEDEEYPWGEGEDGEEEEGDFEDDPEVDQDDLPIDKNKKETCKEGRNRT